MASVRPCPMATGNVDIVVEAVVETQVKQAVLAEVEGAVKEDAIIASNTSTISISLLAQALKRPENLRHAFLQPGAHDAAGGSDPWREDR